MIKLEKVDKQEVERFCRDIYDKLEKNRSTEIGSINSWIFKFFKEVPGSKIGFASKGDNLFQIMIADYYELFALKKFIDDGSHYIEFQKYMGKKISKSGSTPKEFLIKGYDKIDKKKFVSLTNLTVCPYCNRNFINVTEEVNNSQLDHFFPKSHRGNGKRSYPIFALSFYNLIPSCYGCNNKKSDNLFQVSPYDENSYREEFLTFSWQPQVVTSSPWFDAKSIEITMNIPEGNKYKSDFEKLDLQEQYQLHTDYVQELLWKKQVYSRSYKDELKNFKGLGLTEGDFERLVTGAYTEEKNYGKRPLSKMTTEISKEIGLIGED